MLCIDVVCLKIQGMAVNTPVINLWLKQVTSTVWINDPEPFIVFEKIKKRKKDNIKQR